MPIVLGTYGDNTAGGWTVVTPSSGTGPSGFTSNLIYVSDSTGTDAPGSGTVASPCKTIFYALTTATVGTLGVGLRAGHPDWVLLKKGDTWINQVFTNHIDGWGGALHTDGYHFDTSNLATAEPMVITSYTDAGATTSNPRGTGTGPRPLLKVTDNTIWTQTGTAHDWQHFLGSHAISGGPYTEPDYLCVMGIEFYDATNDPNSGSFVGVGSRPAILTNGGNFWLVEDCKASYCAGCIGNPGVKKFIQRRNIAAYNFGYGSDQNATQAVQGFEHDFYSDLTVDGDYAINNGWYNNGTSGAPTAGLFGGPRNTFNHNWYIQYPLTKVTATVSSGGVGTPIVLTWPNSHVPTNNSNYDLEFTAACGPITTQIQRYFASAPTGSTTQVLDSLNGNAVMLANGTEPSTIVITIHDEWTGAKVSVKGIVSMLASYAGVHQRGCGELFDSFFAMNGTNVSYGYPVEPPSQTANSISSIVSIKAQGYNYGTTGGPAWGVIILPTTNPVTVDNAIVAHPDGTAGLLGISIGTANEDASNLTNHGVTIQNSICADWGFVAGPNQTSNILDWTTSLPHNTFTNNVSVAGAPDVGSGSTATYSTQPTWPAPNRSLASYDADSLGGPGTLAHLLTAIIGTPGTLTGQSRDNWDSRLTANSINEYFRAGFGRVSQSHHGGRGLGRF